eukprot:m.423043 g.423043  ORF g.423043 m.423043 type:complete len:76 (-) comp21330_c0_seq17:2080-2307(-)
MVFDPATASAVMAWLLVYDVTSKTSVASPAIAIEHPSELFTQCAVHGGNWRNPYDSGSLGTISYVLGSMGYSYSD